MIPEIFYGFFLNEASITLFKHGQVTYSTGEVFLIWCSGFIFAVYIVKNQDCILRRLGLIK